MMLLLDFENSVKSLPPHHLSGSPGSRRVSRRVHHPEAARAKKRTALQCHLISLEWFVVKSYASVLGTRKILKKNLDSSIYMYWMNEDVSNFGTVPIVRGYSWMDPLK
jgi:hypothetical protein